MRRPQLTAALLAAAFAGCTPKPVPVVVPTPPVAWHPPADKRAAVAELTKREQRFDQQTEQLVGASAATHRRVLVGLLENLSKALQSAFVDTPSPEFTTNIRVIDDAAETVDSQTIERSRMESAEDQALRAAELAVAEIGRRFLFDDPMMPQVLDNLDALVSFAATSRGPNHEADATEAFRALDTALLHLSIGLGDRLDPGTAAMPTRPTMPATLPTTMPAAAPTTMP